MKCVDVDFMRHAMKIVRILTNPSNINLTTKRNGVAENRKE